ncbi:hypothetical protein HMPREF9004_0822 [Schaalia cardiffensis F0333]|uniref:Uncharacterized protein n=1 Tax=Schaalia cardiffensis F0333 TaxID=888050 RepID=N6XAT9_9ACTO|nr:hypothetical protein HMPREF9004_0822 [Schaalia cardiffensis F0333]
MKDFRSAGVHALKGRGGDEGPFTWASMRVEALCDREARQPGPHQLSATMKHLSARSTQALFRVADMSVEELGEHGAEA